MTASGDVDLVSHSVSPSYSHGARALYGVCEQGFGMSAQRSIVIGGGAFAGLALALALRQGLGPGIPDHCGRSGAGDAAEPRSARDRHRRGLPPAVRGHRRVGRGRGRGAADPGHGGHRFETRGRNPPGVSDIRRRCRTRRAIRAHGREPASDRCAGAARRSRGHRSACRAVTDFRPAQTASM